MVRGHEPAEVGPGVIDGIGPIAYFSPEFGLDEALPQYAGGLGVLAGDHLKAADDLGVPLVGVGLFYREGYFRQEVPRSGHQEARYPAQDPASLGLDLVGEGSVDVGTRPESFRVWRHDVGSVALYLVQHDEIADRLYGGDTEHRLRQEILLGMGGLRALDVAGVTPRVFHLNEGHAGFLALERIRRHVQATGASLREAVDALAPSTVFTTHTPVAAGIDRFSHDLIERYFGSWCEEVGAPIDALVELGTMPGDDPGTFNMAAFCLRIAGHANGVSRLHGEVSRRMFAPLWPGREEVPIGHVTNGVHAPTWTAPDVADLLEKSVGPDWMHAGARAWEGVDDLDDDVIRAVRRAAKDRLGDLVAQRGTGPGTALDPDALTVGFARRFATYKRAALLLADRERLARLLLDPHRPVQFVFAGKAHPADKQGQDVLARVVAAAADPSLAGRIVFLADYDMAVARAMVQGCDVWLNTPIRGLEASGTSGEKAALNGVLHCSVLDGWWDEMYDGENGWAIPSSEGDIPGRGPRPEDVADADAAFTVLERDVVPLYFADGAVPSAAWLAKVRHAWRTLGPQVGAGRMVSDYVEGSYRPASR